MPGPTKCPIYGDNASIKMKKADSLKNRNFSPKTINPKITLEAILSGGTNEANEYSPEEGADLSGYIILVKPGGSETCNCHSKLPEDKDIHIELALHPHDPASKAMVCEINRYTKHDMAQFTIPNIKKLIGTKVTIRGLMFYDEEHKQNATATNPKGTHNWRYSCWELHPVSSIIPLYKN